MKTKIKFFTLAIFAVVSLFFVTANLAQTSTTGEISGTVSDQNGAAVPGLNVTLSGANMIGGARTATTNDNGEYRFSAVPPGKYKIEVAAQKGFAVFSRDGLDVNLSSNTTANIGLQLASATATVDVTGGGATIDTVSNTTGTNVSTDQFSNFPTQRTVQSLYSIAPTVARSGLRDASGRDRDPSVAGSSGPENNYILDGVTTTDPAFGGSGANLPFEFVQEVEIKTGAYGAEYGKSTGGIFNVITKAGGNEFSGDVFFYASSKGMVREVKPTAIPATGSAPNGFSEVDAGFDIGGPIVKDKLWFFGAFNPQRRKNHFLTQTFLTEVNNQITTPFYAGKLTWAVNPSHTFTFSTFADPTKQEGHLFGFSGFGANPASFRGTTETGGSNYAFRLNSTFSPNFIAEFSGGLHFQRANTIPELDETLVTDRFAVLRAGSVVAPFETNVTISGLRQAWVEGSGGTVQRNYIRSGFGLESEQDRDRREIAARLQNIWGRNTIKYGFEWTQNRYRINTRGTGPDITYVGGNAAGPQRVENRWAICSRAGSVITCTTDSRRDRVNTIIAAGQGPAGVTSAVTGAVSINPTNPFLLLDTVRVRDFSLNTRGGFTTTDTQSYYIQDDFKATRNFQINFGIRWDHQTAKAGDGSDYIKLTNWLHNAQPRIGFIWDFTGDGKSKFFGNFARFVETPIPLDINVRAAGANVQNDFHGNASRLNGPNGATMIANFGNLGNHPSPAVPNLKPQTVNEWTMGVEREVMTDLVLGFRGIYRAQGTVIEDGSFDDGSFYFIFNPGEGRIEDIAELVYQAYLADPSLGDANAIRASILAGGDVFGRARRYYRGLEFTATKRFSNNYQFIASYVFSSLIGNYEGLFRNDNGQSDPNITSLFDLPSLLTGLYGRLPNDRPHQFKFSGTYRWPFKLMTSATFNAQSGIPFNELIPHFLYGDNEGFGKPRGTAINPLTGRNRTPTTYQLDVGVYYPIAVGEGKELRFTGDIFNVFNSQRAIRQDETFQINSGAPGIAPVPNPFYGRGTIFQFPTALRFGMKFSF